MREQVIAIALELAEKAISKTNRREDYLRITEGRDDWRSPEGEMKTYSWCGDFVSYVLMCAGVTDGSILNRAALNTGVWTPGDNINRIMRWGDQNGASYSKSDAAEMAQPGDIFIFETGRGGHICFFHKWLSLVDYSFETLDGNAKNNATSRNNRVLNGGGSKPLYKAVNIDNMPFECAMPDPDTYKAWEDGTLQDPNNLTAEQIADGGDGPPPTPPVI